MRWSGRNHRMRRSATVACLGVMLVTVCGVSGSASATFATEGEGLAIARGAGGDEYVAGALFTSALSTGVPTLVKYSPTGARLWATNAPVTGGGAVAYGVTATGTGNVYFVGFTDGVMTGSGATYGGQLDAFVSAFSGRGALLWSRQLGSGESDDASGVATDADGNVYVAGRTFGTLPGSPVSNHWCS